MKYFLDSNIFLRFLIKEDEKIFLNCKKLFDLIESAKIKTITSSYILAEIVWVLQSFYKFDKHKIITALKVFNASKIKINDEINLTLALNFFEIYNVKFIDCLIASQKLIQKNKITLISYDKDFDKLKIKRKEPKEII